MEARKRFKAFLHETHEALSYYKLIELYVKVKKLNILCSSLILGHPVQVFRVHGL